MVHHLQRWWGAFRSTQVRDEVFDREARVRPGPLPDLTPTEQRVYEQACENLKRFHPVTGGGR